MEQIICHPCSGSLDKFAKSHPSGPAGSYIGEHTSRAHLSPCSLRFAFHNVSCKTCPASPSSAEASPASPPPGNSPSTTAPTAASKSPSSKPARALGGTIETVLRDGFVIDCGPDGWVTEKPWARELIRELGLHTKLIASNDRDRVTCIASGGKLIPLPANMRMMVPVIQGVPHDRVEDAVRNAIVGSSTSGRTLPLHPGSHRRLRRREPSPRRRTPAPLPPHTTNLSPASSSRHFGEEVLTKVAAPLLSGVFCGDVHTLSVRAVMPRLRPHGAATRLPDSSVTTKAGCPTSRL